MTDLPHHHAYGSVHGSSVAKVQRLVQSKDTAISGLCESFVRNGMGEDAASGNRPISFAGIAVPISMNLQTRQKSQVMAHDFRKKPISDSLPAIPG